MTDLKKLLSESLGLMPGHGRSHWSLEEAAPKGAPADKPVPSPKEFQDPSGEKTLWKVAKDAMSLAEFEKWLKKRGIAISDSFTGAANHVAVVAERAKDDAANMTESAEKFRAAIDQLFKMAKTNGWAVGKEQKEQAMATRTMTRGNDAVSFTYWHGKGSHGKDVLPLMLHHNDKKVAELDITAVATDKSGMVSAEGWKYADEHGNKLLDAAKRLLTAKSSK